MFIHNFNLDVLLEDVAGLGQQTGETLIKEWALVVGVRLWVLYLSVGLIFDWSDEYRIFLAFPAVQAIIEECNLRVDCFAVLLFHEVHEDTALRELVAERTDFGHPQVTQEVLHFEVLV